jgi:MFS-type transporter involved in bile tolerance (Atg22 family)
MVRDATGSHRYGFLFIAAMMALGGWCILRVTRRP